MKEALKKSHSSLKQSSGLSLTQERAEQCDGKMRRLKLLVNRVQVQREREICTTPIDNFYDSLLRNDDSMGEVIDGWQGKKGRRTRWTGRRELCSPEHQHSRGCFWHVLPFGESKGPCRAENKKEINQVYFLKSKLQPIKKIHAETFEQEWTFFSYPL